MFTFEYHARMASALPLSGDPEVHHLVAPDVELSADRGVFDGSWCWLEESPPLYYLLLTR